jgi:hypothetical protein
MEPSGQGCPFYDPVRCVIRILKNKADGGMKIGVRVAGPTQSTAIKATFDLG